LSSPLSPWPSSSSRPSSSSPLATVAVARPRDPVEVARRDAMLQRDARRRAVPSASRRPCLKQTREVSNRRRRDQRGDRWPASRAPLVYFRIVAVVRGEHRRQHASPSSSASSPSSSRMLPNRETQLASSYVVRAFSYSPLVPSGNVTRLTLAERAPCSRTDFKILLSGSMIPVNRDFDYDTNGERFNRR
jgi:hypothetical protein